MTSRHSCSSCELHLYHEEWAESPRTLETHLFIYLAQWRSYGRSLWILNRSSNHFLKLYLVYTKHYMYCLETVCTSSATHCTVLLCSNAFVYLAD